MTHDDIQLILLFAIIFVVLILLIFVMKAYFAVGKDQKKADGGTTIERERIQRK